MLQKFKNHCKNPITWGAYYKLTGVSILASVVIGAAYVVKYMIDMKNFDTSIKEYGINEEEL